MNRDGEIVVIEDDKNDQELFATIFESLNINNEIRFFNNGEDALEYLQHSDRQP